MIDVIKETLNVNIHSIVQVLYLHQTAALRNGGFRRPVRAKTVGVFAEFSLAKLATALAGYIAVQYGQ